MIVAKKKNAMSGQVSGVDEVVHQAMLLDAFSRIDFHKVLADNGVEIPERVKRLKVLLATQKEVEDLEIGWAYFDAPYGGTDYIVFPVDELYHSALAYTVGVKSGMEVDFLVPWTWTQVYVVIQVGKKYCKLNHSEWNPRDNFNNLRPPVQVRLFQRLLLQGQIEMDDLYEADVSEEVISKIEEHSQNGEKLFAQKLKVFEKWAERIYKKQSFARLYKSVIGDVCDMW